MNEYFVYILLCNQKTFYIGITSDIKKRISEHQSKQSFFTKKFSEITLEYVERYQTKTDAAKREKQLKGWSHAKKQLLLEGKLGINSTDIAEVLL